MSREPRRPNSSTSWNVCSSCVRFKRSDRARRCLSALTCAGTASISPSSAGTRPASAWTSSTAPRTRHRLAASSSTRRATRRATSGTCGSKGSSRGSSTAFGSPDPYAPRDGHRFNPNKLVLDPCARAIVPPADPDSRLAVGYDPSSPRKDLSFSDVDNAGSAPKCVIPYEDFDWHGDQPLRLPWTSTVIYELHVRGYTIDPSAERAVSGHVSRVDSEDSVPEGPGRHRRRTDARAGVQRARFVARQPEHRRAAQELLGIRSG